jgi:DNA-directed RNA polymerase subunit alpha
MTNYDKIILQIWTDGTITPDEAMRQGAQVLVQHFQMIAEYGGTVTQGGAPEIKAGPTDYPIPAKIFDTLIEELDLSVRSYNCLKRSGITKVGQVLMMSEDDLLAVRNFGEKSLQELRDRLVARNFLPTIRQGDRRASDGFAALNGDSTPLED